MRFSHGLRPDTFHSRCHWPLCPQLGAAFLHVPLQSDLADTYATTRASGGHRNRPAGNVCCLRRRHERTCSHRRGGFKCRKSVSSLLLELWAALVDVAIKPDAANLRSAIRAKLTIRSLLRRAHI